MILTSVKERSSRKDVSIMLVLILEMLLQGEMIIEGKAE
jgi:hypothetical protein